MPINCCGMFEYGCPGSANSSADRLREGGAGGAPGPGMDGDRCAFIRTLAAVNVAGLKGG